MPDTTTADTAATRAAKVADKIRKLLRLAERAGTEEEAAAALARAQELQVRYSVAEEDIRAADPSAAASEPVGATRHEGVAAGPDRALWTAAARGAGCETIHHPSARALTVVGSDSDRAFCATLAVSLHLQRESFLLTARHSLNPWTDSVREFSKSFRVAYAARVAERLREQREGVAATVDRERGDSGASLVLASRQVAVSAKVAELFPRARPGGALSGGSSVAGMAAGASAANRANLSGGRGSVAGGRRAVSR